MVDFVLSVKVGMDSEIVSSRRHIREFSLAFAREYVVVNRREGIVKECDYVQSRAKTRQSWSTQ
jgi:hypothetical protein